MLITIEKEFELSKIYIKEFRTKNQIVRKNVLDFFLFLEIPRSGEDIVLPAYGSAYDGIPENIYVVERVIHCGCHLAWDTKVFQGRDEAEGPSTTIFVRFVRARTLTANGSYTSHPKGKLRFPGVLPQKYQYKDQG